MCFLNLQKHPSKNPSTSLRATVTKIIVDSVINFTPKSVRLETAPTGGVQIFSGFTISQDGSLQQRCRRIDERHNIHETYSITPQGKLKDLAGEGIHMPQPRGVVDAVRIAEIEQLQTNDTDQTDR